MNNIQYLGTTKFSINNGVLNDVIMITIRNIVHLMKAKIKP